MRSSNFPIKTARRRGFRSQRSRDWQQSELACNNEVTKREDDQSFIATRLAARRRNYLRRRDRKQSSGSKCGGNKIANDDAYSAPGDNCRTAAISRSHYERAVR